MVEELFKRRSNGWSAAVLPGKRSADESEEALDLRPTAMENAKSNGAKIVYFRGEFVVSLRRFVLMQENGGSSCDLHVRLSPGHCSSMNCYSGTQKNGNDLGM